MKKKALKKFVAFPLALTLVTTAFAPVYAETEPRTLSFDGAPKIGGLAMKQLPDNFKKVSTDEIEEMDRAMRAFSPSSDSLVQNNAPEFYYYSHLTSDQQSIYDALMMLTEYPDEDNNFTILFTSINPETDEFFLEVYTAYTAMTLDHPELFWLYNGIETLPVWASDEIIEDSDYIVYFGLDGKYDNCKEQMTAFNNAAEEFLKDIDTSGTEVSTAKQIHDKLIDMVTYDVDILETGVAEDFAHTAYGALVANSDGVSNYAVCDGYSLAYEYLLQQSGIEAAVVLGDAGSDGDMGGHAWNIVKLDGQWYEVDSTWDDSLADLDALFEMEEAKEIEGYEYYVEALSDPDYRNVLSHYLYGVSTPTMRKYTPDESDYYKTKDGLYEISLLLESEHIRYDEADPENIAAGLTVTLPNATSALQ